MSNKWLNWCKIIGDTERCPCSIKISRNACRCNWNCKYKIYRWVICLQHALVCNWHNQGRLFGCTSWSIKSIYVNKIVDPIIRRMWYTNINLSTAHRLKGREGKRKNKALFWKDDAISSQVNNARSHTNVFNMFDETHHTNALSLPYFALLSSLSLILIKLIKYVAIVYYMNSDWLIFWLLPSFIG